MRVAIFTLFLFITIPFAYCIDFSTGITFQEVGEGNVTFSDAFSAEIYQGVAHQNRFRNIEMNANSSWSYLGFRCPNATSTINVTNIGDNYIALNVTTASPTFFEVYLIDAGIPNHINGVTSYSWNGETLNVTRNNDGRITLEWDAAAAGGTGSWFNLFMVLAGLIGTIILLGR